MQMNPHFDYFSMNLSQDMRYPLSIPALSQPRHQVSRPRLDYLNQSKTNSVKNPSTFDCLAEPNKRIRLSHQSFTKVSSNIREISHSRQSLEKANFARDQLNLTCKDDLNLIFADKFRQTSSPAEEELIIPSLNNFSQDSFQRFSFQAYQKMLQQMEQRKTQFYAQQQFMMQFARQQIHSQMEAEHIKPEVAQIHTAGMSEAKKEDTDEDENNFEYIQLEDSVETKGSDYETNHTEKPQTESKASLKKEKSQKQRRNKNDEYWKEYSRMLGNNIHKPIKEESRHQNRWQCQKEMEVSKTLGQENADGNSLATPQENIKTKKSAEPSACKKPSKPTKPLDTPQHLQDDSMVDYENLISMTITNDPAYTGIADSRDNFVMISKNTNPLCVQARDTRVGDRYQVSVPEYKVPVAGKRRNLKTTWRPEIVKENDLKAYFDELCQIFSCEKINQVEALRLLKSKKYRKEGVVGNIGKNRNYYAKILMAPDSC